MRVVAMFTTVCLGAMGCSGESTGSSECGTVLGGGSCSGQGACACGLTCLSGKCGEMYNAPSAPLPAPPPPPTEPSGQSAKGFCDWATKTSCLPGGGDEVGCHASVARHEQLTGSGCVAQSATVLDCFRTKFPGCPSGDTPLAADGLKAWWSACLPEMKNLEKCIGCDGTDTICKDGEHIDGLPEAVDAQPGGCTVRSFNLCQEIRVADCSPTGSGDTAYLCTCLDDALKPASTTFHAYAKTCCGLQPAVASSCAWSPHASSVTVALPPPGPFWSGIPAPE